MRRIAARVRSRRVSECGGPPFYRARMSTMCKAARARPATPVSDPVAAPASSVSIACASCSCATSLPANIGAAARAMHDDGPRATRCSCVRALSRCGGDGARVGRNRGARRRAGRAHARRGTCRRRAVDRRSRRGRANSPATCCRFARRPPRRPTGAAQRRRRAGVRHRDVRTHERRARALQRRSRRSRRIRRTRRSISRRPCRSPRTSCASPRLGGACGARRASSRRRTTRSRRCYAHAQRTLVAMRFLDPRGRGGCCRGFAACSRATGLEREEVNILRGILTRIDALANRGDDR